MSGITLTPQSLFAQSFLTPHSIPVNWRPLSTGFGVERTMAFRVTYVAVEAGGEVVVSPSHTIIVRPKVLSVLITGLQSFTTYEIKVAAVTRHYDRPASVVYAGMQIDRISC
mgnify:CR=1 FL=1